jgi:uncharacterized protein YcfJ
LVELLEFVLGHYRSKMTACENLTKTIQDVQKKYTHGVGFGLGAGVGDLVGSGLGAGVGAGVGAMVGAEVGS